MKQSILNNLIGGKIISLLILTFCNINDFSAQFLPIITSVKDKGLVGNVKSLHQRSVYFSDNERFESSHIISEFNKNGYQVYELSANNLESGRFSKLVYIYDESNNLIESHGLSNTGVDGKSSYKYDTLNRLLIKYSFNKNGDTTAKYLYFYDKLRRNIEMQMWSPLNVYVLKMKYEYDNKNNKLSTKQYNNI